MKIGEAINEALRDAESARVDGDLVAKAVIDGIITALDRQGKHFLATQLWETYTDEQHPDTHPFT